MLETIHIDSMGCNRGSGFAAYALLCLVCAVLCDNPLGENVVIRHVNSIIVISFLLHSFGFSGRLIEVFANFFAGRQFM